MALLLVHGGLWDDGGAEFFWHRPGIVAGLGRHGFEVHAPDRLARPPDWPAETAQLISLLPDQTVTVVAGSNGCSAAVLLALAVPDRIERLLLAWPATANDPTADALARDALAGLGATPETIIGLLTGQTLRGVTDADLAGITVPVGVLPSVPDNLVHQRHTIDALHRLLPRAIRLPGYPEPPHPNFPPHLEPFLDTVAGFAGSQLPA